MKYVVRNASAAAAATLGALVLLAGCGDTDEPDLATGEAALSAAQCMAFQVGGKTTICHQTGSARNPVVKITVATAGCIQGHASQHRGDYVSVDGTCTNACLPSGSPCDESLGCCNGLTCTNGTCQSSCEAPLSQCGADCTDVANDVDHCGLCDNPCEAPANATATCTNGGCGYTCNAGFTDCGGACVDVQDDATSCGGCGLACPEGVDCVGGYCKVGLVQSLSYGGPGCPQGSVGTSVNSERSAFTLIYDQFVSSLGAGVPITENRKQCELQLRVQVPAGFRPVLATQVRGYVQVSDGVLGENTGITYRSGEEAQTAGSHLAVGPDARDYLLAQTAVAGTDCSGDRIVVFNDDARLFNVSAGATAIGQVTVDSTDGQILAQPCACPPGVDTSSDPDNCGACGVACGADQSCSGGVCTCGAGERRCGDQCVPAVFECPPAATDYVTAISYGGTGCPAGSVATSLTTTRDSFSLAFDRAVASSGPGIPITENRKNCQLNLNIRRFAGFRTRLAVDYRGFVQAPSGSTGEQTSTYYYQGELAQDVDGSTFLGSVRRRYLRRDELVSPDCNASPMGTITPTGMITPTNVNAQARLVSPSSSLLTIDGIDARLVTEKCACEPADADLTSDPLNCGACGNVCRGGSQCIDANCQCPAGQTECASACVDLASDPLNCGDCGLACDAGSTCVGGACV